MPKTKNKPGIHLYKDYEYKPGSSKPTIWWFWHIVARNGRIIARSSETYSRKAGAVKSIKVVADIFCKVFIDEPAASYYDHSKPDSPLTPYV